MAAPIVLFDLDGTVVTFEGAAPGPGRTALDRAAAELHALEGATSGIRLAGGTDRAFARLILRRAAVADDDDAIEALLAAYVRHLEAVLQTRRYVPVGAVANAVAALEARDCVVGIATGNTRRGARLKLASAGLEPAFDLARGAYGCEAEPRAAIVRLAIERCSGAGRGPVVVVGDTVHDVTAARDVGARVVGVAINAASREELVAAGADAVVDACGDALVEAVVRCGGLGDRWASRPTPG